MRILIISVGTYPNQDPRSFRTAELSEELARLGHKVTVYVPQSDYDYAEYMVRTGVIVRPIRMRFSANKNTKTGRVRKVVDYILCRLLKNVAEWPLIEFKYRVPEVFKNERKADCLITIAYPHTIHWGAALARKKYPEHFPNKWIADCGDPFMFNPYRNPPHYFAKEEKRWCKFVDYITVPTESSKDGYYSQYRDKIRVIPQGFSFEKTPIAEYRQNSIPTFAYTGAIYRGMRDPFGLLDYLSSLNENFKIILYLRNDIPEKYHKALGNKLEVNLNWKRKDIIYDLSKAEFLINIPNSGSTVQTPSKLIDYSLAHRPVLNVTTDFAQQKEVLQFIHGDYSAQMQLPDISAFDIKNVVRQFLALI